MGRIQQIAHSQAQAEYGPQKRAVRRETGSAVRSIRSMTPALEAALGLAEKGIRHAGLSPVDRALALSELANRNVDVAAGQALQIGQVRQDAHSQLVDLATSEGQAQRGYLGALQQEALKRQQGIADARRSNLEQFHLGIKEAEVLHHLGITSSGASANGLTPTQQRAHDQSKHNASFFARQYISAARHGLTDEKTGKEVLPPGPHNWNDQQWNLFVEKVASKKGVNSITDAQHAVGAIREHFQPTTGGPWGLGNGLLRAIAGAASSSASAAPAPQSQPIPQFGSRRR